MTIAFRVRNVLTACWLGLILGLPASAVAQPAAYRPILEAFGEKLRGDVDQDDIGSIAAAVIDGGQIIWRGMFGLADRDRQIQAESRHIYRVGSISKTVTAVVMLQLAERGIVSLDDPVVKHLPEFDTVEGNAAAIRSITLRHLASHTSGLIREPDLPGAASGDIRGWVTQVRRSIPNTNLQSAPGAKYSYSNIGFGILGLALQRAANTPFMDLANQHVFAPLGIEHDVYIVSPNRQADLATGYAPGPNGGIDPAQPALEHAGRGYKVPNGGVYNTIDELALFAAALAGHTPTSILSRPSRAEMFRVHTPEDPANGYGLGLTVRRSDDGIVTYGHGGSVAGYTAYMIFEPDTGLGVVLLRNYNRGRTDLGRAAADVLRELVRTSR